jgi:hypothetical protein
MADKEFLRWKDWQSYLKTDATAFIAVNDTYQSRVYTALTFRNQLAHASSAPV